MSHLVIVVTVSKSICKSGSIGLFEDWNMLQKQPPRGVLGKDVLKICSKFTGEHPCRSMISIKLLSNFIEITLRHGCSPVNLLHIFRTPFLKNTSDWLLLMLELYSKKQFCCKLHIRKKIIQFIWLQLLLTNLSLVLANADRRYLTQL